MSTVTTTVHDALLKEYYMAGGLVRQFYTETPLLNRVERITDQSNFDGRRIVMGAHTSRNQGYGFRGENVALPEAGASGIDNMYVEMAYIYGKIKMTGQMMQFSSTSRGAFVNGVDHQINDIKEGVKFDIARAVAFGDGSGALCQANGSGASSTSLTVDGPGARHLYANMKIDIYTAKTGGTQEVNSVTVSSVNRSTNVVTLATASTWTDNSYVFREDTRGTEMQGLPGLCDDGTLISTIQGKTRSTDTWTQANVLDNSGTNRPMTLRLIDDGYYEATNNGSGGYPSGIYSNVKLAQTYADLCRTDRRYASGVEELDGGWRGIKHTGMDGSSTWLVDPMCRDNAIYFIPEKDLVYYVPVEFSWLGEEMGGQIWRPATDGTDAYEATLKSYQNLAAKKFQGMTLLSDVTQV